MPYLHSRWPWRNLAPRLPIERLETRVVLTADPIITEFQAANESTLTDEDGDFSDWIEFHNPDFPVVELGGWYITDDPADLQKWQFPSGVQLELNEYLLVFASGKNRTSAGELHANFRLAGSGEFLALVKPDGVTTVQSFSPYPRQDDDTSYGLAVGRIVTDLIPDGHAVRALVPTDDSLGIDWINVGFDDSQWLSGDLGVGYELSNQGFVVQDDFDSSLASA